MSGRIVVPGQAPMIAGAVAVRGLVYTSGIVCGRAMTEAVPIEEQVDEAVDELVRTLASAGATPIDVVKIDAYLHDAQHFPVWNARYAEVWTPEAPPARITTVCGFAAPHVLFEVSAVAVVE